MKVTVDTNVLISATFWCGDSFRVLQLVESKRIQLVLSREILEEYTAVLNYDEIQEKIKGKNLEMKQTIEKIQAMSIFVIPHTKLDVVKDDPDDNVILECALEGSVQYIITQDKHLLKLREFQKIKIITSSLFLKIVTQT